LIIRCRLCGGVFKKAHLPDISSSEQDYALFSLVVIFCFFFEIPGPAHERERNTIALGIYVDAQFSDWDLEHNTKAVPR
jgi:hypothetical protein